MFNCTHPCFSCHMYVACTCLGTVFTSPPPTTPAGINLLRLGGVARGSMQPVIEANNAESCWSGPDVARGAEVFCRLASTCTCITSLVSTQMSCGFLRRWQGEDMEETVVHPDRQLPLLLWIHNSKLAEWYVLLCVRMDCIKSKWQLLWNLIWVLQQAWLCTKQNKCTYHYLWSSLINTLYVVCVVCPKKQWK